MVEPSPGMSIVAHDEEQRLPAKLRPMLTDRAIAAITYDLKMAEKLVTTVLEEGIDFGQIPGVPGKGLWDPGGSKIINAFECYPRHKILYHEETDAVITWAIEAEIIHRESQQIVGAGVGACSTREPKYKYIWVVKEEALRMGYTEPQIDEGGPAPAVVLSLISSLKKRKGKRRNSEGNWYEVEEYHVENPEYGQQVNTILQMAAKRSETDAAKTLPAVASALRRLLSPPEKDYKGGKGKAAKNEKVNDDSPRWTTFWNAMKDILGEGYREKAHEICGVKSMDEWIKAGKQLDDAIRLASEWAAAKQQVFARELEWDRVTQPQVDTYEKLETLWEWLTGRKPKDLYRELGVGSKADIKMTPWDAFVTVKAVFGPPKPRQDEIDFN